MLSLLRALALPAALLFALPATAHDGVHIADPYARIVQGNGVVYFRIDNHADAADRLISASSDVGMAMLMTTSEDANGMMQMRDAPDGFAVDPGASRVLQPAGDHVMLMHLHHAPAEGETLTLTLVFERAGQVTLTVPVANDRRTPPGLEPTPFDVTSGEHAAQAAIETGMMSTPATADQQAIIAVMKAQFDKPEAPLTVDPVVVAGAHAVASWAQGDMAGRALLEKGPHGWVVVLCGGPELRSPDFLAQHGVTDAAMLSQMFNASEDALGADRVARYSSFEGIVMMSEHAHD